MKGAIGRTFRVGFDFGKLPVVSRLTHLFPIDSVFILRRNILRYIRHRILDRKPDNTANGILVKTVNAIKSNTYRIIVFLTDVMKKKISVVDQKLLNDLFK